VYRALVVFVVISVFLAWIEPLSKGYGFQGQGHKGLQGGDGFELALRAKLQRMHAGRNSNFANARSVRQLFDKAFEACATRVLGQGLDEQSRDQALRMLHAGDLDDGVN
jgi:hypothetical protein